tara:strand:+ start:188 stop:430 length:243 start_codon:yes stop_codon:yes gene_type:complete
MSTLLEDLKRYFRETPREKIMSDWAKSEKFDNVGPPVDEFIEFSKKYYTVECPNINTISRTQISNLINNPKSNLRVSSFN